MYASRWSMLALLVCACVAHGGTNSWSLRGPMGGMVTELAIDPANHAIVYAAAGEFVYKSTDAGASWVQLSNLSNTYTVWNLALDPTNSAKLYVASLSGGLLATTDDGATFSQVGPVPTDGNVDGPWDLVISADGETIYYSTFGTTIFRSTDGGATFVERSMPYPSGTLVIDPSDSEIVYAASLNGLLKTTNGGESWSMLPHPQPPDSYIVDAALLPGSPNTLWVSTAQNVYSSENDGASWTPAPIVLPDHALYQDTNYPSVLYAATFGGYVGPLHRYEEGSWHELSPLSDAVNAVAISPANAQTVLVGGQGGGVWRSVDGGENWARSNDGLIANLSRAVAVGGGRIYAGTTHGELAFTDEDGEFQASTVSPGFPLTPVNRPINTLAVHPTDANIIVAGLDGAGLKTSHDGGESWIDGPAEFRDSIVEALTFDPSNPQVVYASLPPSPSTPTRTLQRSENAGLSFAIVDSDLPANSRIERLAVDPLDSSRLFAASLLAPEAQHNGIFRSEDSGRTWTKVHTNAGTFDIVFDRASPARLYALADSTLLISDDAGDSFQASTVVPNRFASPFSIALDPHSNDVLYVLASDSIGSKTSYYIMRSVDRALSWEQIPNPLRESWTPIRLSVNSATPTVLFASTTQGMQSFEVAPDSGIAILAHSGARPIGLASSFDIRLQNEGPLAATNVTAIIQLPSGVEDVAASIDQGSCSVAGPTVTCELSHLKVTEPVTARVEYTPMTAGPINVQATVTSRERDPQSANNTASAGATAAPPVDLVLTGSASATSVNQGASFTTTFQLRNNGPNDSVATRVQLTAGTGVRFTSISPNTCVIAGSTIDCDLGSLAAAETVTILAGATADSTGVLRITATTSVSDAMVESNPTDNSAAVEVSSRSAAGGGSGSGGGGGGSFSIALLLALAALRSITIFERSRCTRNVDPSVQAGRSRA